MVFQNIRRHDFPLARKIKMSLLKVQSGEERLLLVSLQSFDVLFLKRDYAVTCYVGAALPDIARPNALKFTLVVAIRNVVRDVLSHFSPQLIPKRVKTPRIHTIRQTITHIYCHILLQTKSRKNKKGKPIVMTC